MSIRRQLGDLAKSLDSSAVGSFLSKGASEADFTTISYSDVSGTPSVVADSAVALSIIDSAYVQARVTTVAAGLDSATTINLLDSNYMAARSGGGAGFYVYNYDATAGQTTFQDSDAAGNVMSYSTDGIIVFYNGVMLPTADYTADDGTSVVLGTGADSQDVVTIAKWSVGGGAGSSGGAAVWYGDRAVVGGGNAGSNPLNIIDYYDITTPGNASDFGDLTAGRDIMQGAVSDATYGLFFGGKTSYDLPTVHTNVIDYITISTTGNATDFGDMTTAGSYGNACSDGVYGVSTSITDYNPNNDLEYVTIATPGNATDFGTLTETISRPGALGNDTYGLFLGGNRTSSPSSTIDYITIASPGNASDFGDLTVATRQTAACSDDTYGVKMGGSSAFNVIDYVTVATPSNASDFGDLVSNTEDHAACSNGTYGNSNGNGFPTWTNTIEYITIASPGNASDFGDLTTARKQLMATSGSPS